MDCKPDDQRSDGQGRDAPRTEVSRSDTPLASIPGLGTRPYRFEELFGDAVVVNIQLGDKVYELRRTKSGKLVLNR